MVKDVKSKGLRVTCEVHRIIYSLMMNIKSLDPNFRTVKPVLNTKEDRDALGNMI